MQEGPLPSGMAVRRIDDETLDSGSIPDTSTLTFVVQRKNGSLLHCASRVRLLPGVPCSHTLQLSCQNWSMSAGDNLNGQQFAAHIIASHAPLDRLATDTDEASIWARKLTETQSTHPNKQMVVSEG